MTTAVTGVIGGLALGLGIGYALQRGGFCMNTAFRSVSFEKDRTLLRAWLVVVAINVVGVNLLAELGLIGTMTPPLYWPALLLGGFVFGLGMVLAGGCASGTCYRVGRGMLGSWAALLGFIFGTAAMDGGALVAVQENMRIPTIEIAGSEPTLFNLVGIQSSVGRWVLIAAILVPAMVYLARAPKDRFVIGWTWRKTGVVVGILALAAWVVSSAHGRDFGLSFTQPAVGLTRWLIAGDGGGVSVATYMFVGVPVGAWLAAVIRKEAMWRIPDARTFVRQLGGGATMGLGASLAGGCNIGHGITGIATLSVGSIVATFSIMLGGWAMTALVFFRATRAAEREMAAQTRTAEA